MNLSGQPQIFAKDVYGTFAPASGEAAPHRIGTPGYDGAGRKFRFVQAGATTLVPGTAVQAPAIVANHINLAVNTALAVVGATSLLVVLGATAVNANYYAGGTVMVSNGAGIGYGYTIASHPAGASSGNIVVQLVASESLQVAADTNTRVDLVSHPYKNVIINPTTPTGPTVGIAVSAITNGQFGWVQTAGYGPCLIEGTPAVGQPVAPSGNVAGALSVAYTTGSNANVAAFIASMANNAVIGRMAETGVDARKKQVFITIE